MTKKQVKAYIKTAVVAIIGIALLNFGAKKIPFLMTVKNAVFN